MFYNSMMLRPSVFILISCFLYIVTTASSVCGYDVGRWKDDMIQQYQRTSDYAPVWSSDGSWLLFPWGNKIWRVTRDGQQFSEFSFNDDEDHNSFSPSVSKYGSVLYRHFVFEEGASGSFSSDPSIRITDFDGSNDRELIKEGDDNIKHPVWAPNGDHFAFIRRDYDTDRNEIVIMTSDGSNIRSYHTLYNPDRPVWSRDDSHIAVVDYYHDWEEQIDYWRLSVIRLEDGFTRILMEVNSADRQRIDSRLDWSFANDRIYFVMHELNRDGGVTGSTIYSVEPDGTDRERVFRTSNEDTIGRVDVSPDGEKILFQRHSDSEGRFGLSVLHVMNLDGTESKRLIPYFSVYDVSWSPYGSRIAFSADFVVEPDNLLHLVRDYSRIQDNVYTDRFKVLGFFVMKPDGTDARWLAQSDRIPRTNYDFGEFGMPISTLGRWVFGSRESIMEPVANE